MHDYRCAQPNPVAVYSASIPGSAVFTWLLVPPAHPATEFTATLVELSADQVTLQIRDSRAQTTAITVPLGMGTPKIDAVPSKSDSTGFPRANTSTL